MKTVSAKNAKVGKTYMVSGTKLRLRVVKNRDTDDTLLINTVAEVEGRGIQQISAETVLEETDSEGFLTEKEKAIKSLKELKNSYVYRTHLKRGNLIICGGGGKNSTIVETEKELMASEKPCSVCQRKIGSEKLTKDDKTQIKEFAERNRTVKRQAEKPKAAARRTCRKR